jgi:hypothetical protein
LPALGFVMILLLKVTVTILVVSTLSLIAERISPRAAGILSGYPLGSAISLFFIGIEQNAEFAGQSAIYNVAGLSALLSFFYIYYHVSIRARRLVIPLSAAAALGGFFAITGLLQLLHLPPLGCVLAGGGAILGFGALFRAIPNASIASRVRLGPRVMLIRAALAAGVILLITGAAGFVPPSWAGLFSAFPATVFPLLLIMHTTYGARQAHTIIKNLPTGLWALVAYSLTISIAYPRLGMYWGTLLGFAAATLYLLALAWLSGYRPKPVFTGGAFARKKI